MVEPLKQIDALLDGKRGSFVFTKLDLANSYQLLLMRAADRCQWWKTTLRSQLGQLNLSDVWSAMAFSLYITRLSPSVSTTGVLPL